MSAEVKSLDTADFAVFGVLTALGYLVGIYFSWTRRRRIQATQGESEFEEFLGGRSLPAIALSVSLLASVANSVGVVSFVAHYYAHGFHAIWSLASTPIVTAFSAWTLVPLLYSLRVSTVFQYLRMRFNNAVGIMACIVYFVFSQILGAVAIFSVAVGISTMLSVPLLYSNIAIGLTGTIYTALGGLRGVVWADCIQGLVMFASPLTMVGKVLYDAKNASPPLRPMSDFDFTEYFFRTNLDITSDENFWSGVVAAIPFVFVRMAFDQMAVQRSMAAKTLKDAKRIAIAGPTFIVFFFVIILASGMAIIYWYRDCDPVRYGAISSYEQIVPYYLKESLSGATMLRGLFLAGLLGASTSTVSSLVNSLATTFYIDVVTPHVKLNERAALHVIRLLALFSGTVMTCFAIAVPLLGTAARLLLSFSASCSGPFAGLVFLAISSPWVNAKGAAWSYLLVCGLLLWHAVGRTMSSLALPPRIPTTLARCPLFTNGTNQTSAGMNLVEPLLSNSPQEVFPLYQISFFWISSFGFLLTLLLGNVISLATGGIFRSRRNSCFTSNLFLNFWSRFKFMRELLQIGDETKSKNVPKMHAHEDADDAERAALDTTQASARDSVRMGHFSNLHRLDFYTPNAPPALPK
ncbi:sodium-coupled monocarboxylate transporter 1-like [Haemaphysalis longicornis]